MHRYREERETTAVIMRRLRDRRGQHVFLEYGLTFALVTAFVVAMTTYVQRSVQGRVRDAHQIMIGIVADEVPGQGMLINQHYEPYYAEVDSTRTLKSSETRILEGSLPTSASGIFTLESDSLSAVDTQSNQTSPRNADYTGVIDFGSWGGSAF